MVRTSLFAALASVAAIATAHAQAAAPPTCAAPEYRQMDFWVGDWDLDFDASPGVIGHATNHITKDEFGDCVITEHFRQPATRYVGGSWSIWDPAARTWRQTWVDNQGGVFVLTGGPVTGKPYIFELQTLSPVGAQQSVMRMIWERPAADRLVWRWQAEQPDGSWKDSWVLRYTRRKE